MSSFSGGKFWTCRLILHRVCADVIGWMKRDDPEQRKERACQWECEIKLREHQDKASGAMVSEF